MTKIDSLRRFFHPCFHNSSASNKPIPKRRLSTSLRDDLPGPLTDQDFQNQNHDRESFFSQSTITATLAPPRPSKTMVVGTIFGTRRGHVWFSVQNNRLSTKPLLLLELSLPTHQLVKEMQCGLVRIALECDPSDLSLYPLRSVPLWTLYCNGKRVGSASRRKVSDQSRLILKTMQSMTVGAGVIPSGYGSLGNPEDIMYMRANFEHVVGSADSESFHLIGPDECTGQELSVFLIRSGALVVAKMLEGKAILLETDMPEVLQSHVMELAYQVLDLHEVSDSQSIAYHIKPGTAPVRKQ